MVLTNLLLFNVGMDIVVLDEARSAQEFRDDGRLELFINLWVQLQKTHFHIRTSFTYLDDDFIS